MKKFGDESGQTLVMVALSMAILLGFTAFATDVGVMLHQKRHLQSAADSAAIAAGSAISSHQDGVAAGINDATLNGVTAATDSNGNATTTVNIYTTPIDGHFAGQTGYVEAVITQQQPTFFMRVFGQNFMTIKVRAVATYLGQGTACGWSLHHNSAGTSGNPWGNSTIYAPNCGFLFNGNLVLGASDAMNVSYVGATGAITGWGKSDTGTQESGIPGFTDPMPWLSNTGQTPLPTVQTDSSGNPYCVSPDNTTPCFLNQTLVNQSSGTYAGQLLPGIYYYSDNTKFAISGTVVGNNVTLVFGSTGALPAKAGLTGNTSLTITAPSTGPYPQIAVLAPTYTGQLPLDFGATQSIYNGVVYAPNADLSLQDQGAMSSSGYGVIVQGALIVGTLDVNDKNKGNLELLGFSNNTPSPIPRISLVE